METLQIANNQFQSRDELDAFVRALSTPVMLEISSSEAKRFFLDEGTIIFESRVSVV
jgi:hypothetical protein